MPSGVRLVSCVRRRHRKARRRAPASWESKFISFGLVGYMYRETYNGAIVYKARLLVRLVQPELILHLARSIDGVGDYVGRGQTLRFVSKHDQFIGVGIVFWVRRKSLRLYLAERIVASGLQCDWVDCIWLRGDVRLLADISQ